MRLKKLGVALLAVVALGAVMASSAFAAASTGTGPMPQWYVNGSSSPLTGTRVIKLALTSNATLVSKVGTKETEIELVGKKASCVGCTIENAKSKEEITALGHGQVRFEEVSVSKPANCKVISSAGVSGQVISTAQTVEANWMNGTVAVQKFIPTAGEGKSFATFELENNGGTCAAAGLYSVTGTLFANASNATGVGAVEQPVSISPAIETEDGGGLFIGTKAANLTTNGNFSLEPKEKEKPESFLVK